MNWTLPIRRRCGRGGMMRCTPMAGEVTKLDQELAARDDASDKIEVIDGAQEDRDQLRVVARKEWESWRRNLTWRNRRWMRISPMSARQARTT